MKSEGTYRKRTSIENRDKTKYTYGNNKKETNKFLS
jgi:hypothetical protein